MIYIHFFASHPRKNTIFIKARDCLHFYPSGTEDNKGQTVRTQKNSVNVMCSSTEERNKIYPRNKESVF